MPLRPTVTDLTRHHALLAGVLCAVALSACGGGGGSSSSDFLSKGDAVCRAGQSEFDSLQATPPKSAKQAAAQTAKLIAVSQDEVRKLRALTPPASLRSAFDAYLKSRDEAIAVLRKGEDAANRNDPQGYASAKQEVAAGQPRRYDLAKKVGFKVCSKPQLRAPGQS
jgi:hypothetical protein